MQGKIWLLTIPAVEDAAFPFPEDFRKKYAITWLRGQMERGEGGYLHYQLLVGFDRKCRRRSVSNAFPTAHIELSRSAAASAYVWKENTRVGEPFEFGCKPTRVNSKEDWESIWEAAKIGDLTHIPPRIRIISYRTIRAIASDHARVPGIVKECFVYWGATGTGKSRTAWDLAGVDAYSKDPRSKFWDGYDGQESVVIDEFRGGIDISHILRWTDRYPVRVEIKGASRPLLANKIWITSNISPDQWYPDIDPETLMALKRRLNVVHYNKSL